MISTILSIVILNDSPQCNLLNIHMRLNGFILQKVKKMETKRFSYILFNMAWK